MLNLSFIALTVLILVALGTQVLRLRRTRHQLADIREQSARDLARIRQIDRMLLANLSLGYIAQEIANVIPDRGFVRGGTIRQAKADGSLAVLAISEKLNRTGKGFGRLAHASLDARQVTHAGSRLVQAINQRQVIAGDRLREFETPLKPEEADRLQERLGVKSVVAYPVIANEQVHGVVTYYLRTPYDRLSENEKETLQALTDGVAVAMVNAELLDEIDVTNQRLSDANVNLRKADRSKDEFVSIASHQLRGPLTAVRGYLAMLLDTDFGVLPKRQRPIVEQIAESTNEVINILNDMLSVSRINAQRLELSKGAARLEDIAHDVVGEFESLAQKQGLGIVLESPKQPLGVLNLDALRVRQVIVNFVDNAIKYSKQGTVRVRVREDHGDAVLEVIDQGIGISEADRAKMFTKFFRAGNARDVLASGTGLGLYVAKRIIEEHHGSVVLESTEGHGSTFGFRLPLTQVRVADKAATSKKPQPVILSE